MEKLKLAFLVLSLVGIAFCLGVSVWLYLEGLGWIYMLLFFLAFLWQGRMLWSFLRQNK
ncbi:MAG: hypothetical protein IJV06_05225 [Bacteroidaceae bacterium]|nr:hypothetical protein [Bacteroidaceae bacterium]